MLRAGVRPSRRLQSCRRPPSGSWGSCSWLHSDSIWVGDTKDSQLPRLGCKPNGQRKGADKDGADKDVREATQHGAGDTLQWEEPAQGNPP